MYPCIMRIPIANRNYSEIAQTYFILKVLEIICVTPQVPIHYIFICLRRQRVVFKIVKCNTLGLSVTTTCL